MAWHVSNSAGILASRFHSNSFTTLPLYASEPKAAAEVKAAPEERDPPAPAPLDREALLRKVFASCDDDGSGALSVSQFAQLAASQSDIAMAMQEAVFAMLDANSDASLSADEFVKFNLANGDGLEDAEFAAQVAQWQALADARSVKSAEPAPPAAEETAVVSGHAQAEELFEKVSEGDVDGLTALLDAGVPAACVNDEGSTALIVAAEGEGECVTLLLARGCPVNHQNAEGLTALMQGVKYEDISIVQAIFAAGASLEPKDSDGNTAVDLARELADPEICNLLTGENKKMEERAPPPMDDGNVRRNSVSGQNIEEFTETYEQKN